MNMKSRHERKLLKNASEPFMGVIDLRKKYPLPTQKDIRDWDIAVGDYILKLVKGVSNGTRK